MYDRLVQLADTHDWRQYYFINPIYGWNSSVYDIKYFIKEDLKSYGY